MKKLPSLLELQKHIPFIKDNREYFKKKFVIADANKPMYVSFFNGNVSIVYKKEI